MNLKRIGSRIDTVELDQTAQESHLLRSIS